jgi:hypothetical protein
MDSTLYLNMWVVSESTHAVAGAISPRRLVQRGSHSDEARLVSNFAHVPLLVGKDHPMFKEPVRSQLGVHPHELRFRSSRFGHLPFSTF